VETLLSATDAAVAMVIVGDVYLHWMELPAGLLKP
jgi:hypothetical protein